MLRKRNIIGLLWPFARLYALVPVQMKNRRFFVNICKKESILYESGNVHFSNCTFLNSVFFFFKSQFKNRYYYYRVIYEII